MAKIKSCNIYSTPSPPRINASYISAHTTTISRRSVSCNAREEVALSVNAYHSMLLQEDRDLDRTIKSLGKYFTSKK